MLTYSTAINKAAFQIHRNTVRDFTAGACLSMTSLCDDATSHGFTTSVLTACAASAMNLQCYIYSGTDYCSLDTNQKEECQPTYNTKTSITTYT